MIRRILSKLLKIAGILILGIGLVYAIWQPVFPSSILIKGMADSIDPEKIQTDQGVVVRFDLYGKGGGVYSIKADHSGARMIRGTTETVDLIIFMKATDFNDMMFGMSLGEGDPSLITRLIISDMLSYAGDISVLNKLLNT